MSLSPKAFAARIRTDRRKKGFNPAAAPYIVDGPFPSPAAVSARRASGLEKGEYGHDSAIHLPFFDEAKLLED